jgi:hypothetical protein
MKREKIKTLEEKKKAKLPRYVKVKELEDHLNSKEMQELLRQLKEREEYLRKTRNVSVGEY